MDDKRLTSMQHLNGNLLCAVDVETTGLEPGVHDLIQICILPLDSQIKPIRHITPFYYELQPKRPENVDRSAASVHRLNVAELSLRALDAFKVADLFVEWVDRLKLPERKKIIPLATNWPFDRGFIIDWLGPETFQLFFHFHYRDTMTAALYLNDRADFHTEKVPFAKVGLNESAKQFGIHNENAHDALSDCITTAELYRQLLMMYTM